MPRPPQVAVTRSLLADSLTPVTAFWRLRGDAPAGSGYHFLLESAEHGERWARYSFIGAGVRGTFEANGQAVDASGSLGAGRGDVADPLALLYERVAAPTSAASAGAPFTGGAVGYLSYDVARRYERLPDANPDPLGIPDLRFFEPAVLVVFDHFAHRVHVTALADDGDDASRAAAAAAVDAAVERLLTATPLPGQDPVAATTFASTFTQASYEDAVRRAVEYVRAGDVFQVVPAQRFSAPLPVSAFAVYRALRTINPSPHMGYLELGDVTLVAASPESLCRSDGREVVTRPIAGTRPRGADADADAVLAADLRADPKELAEHLMLVDLGRNDLGRVCEYGTVRVDEFCRVERYSHVMHLVSTVRGRLRPECTPLDALAATLPMGTVSGAPKVRAMEIIDELEPVRRSWYGGAFGYLAHSGAMDMALSLRTALVKDGWIHIQAGGGVVADSDPTTEYQESVNKARALRAAVEMAEQGLR